MAAGMGLRGPLLTKRQLKPRLRKTFLPEERSLRMFGPLVREKLKVLMAKGILPLASARVSSWALMDFSKFLVSSMMRITLMVPPRRFWRAWGSVGSSMSKMATSLVLSKKASSPNSDFNSAKQSALLRPSWNAIKLMDCMLAAMEVIYK